MLLRVLVRVTVGLVVVVAVLALYVRQSCACTVKWKAYRASMKSDLRLLADAEAEHVAREHGFAVGAASNVGVPMPLPGTTFVPSWGVTIVVDSADGGGWRARASHDYTDVTCSLTGDSTTGRRPGAQSWRLVEPTCSR